MSNISKMGFLESIRISYQIRLVVIDDWICIRLDAGEEQIEIKRDREKGSEKDRDTEIDMKRKCDRNRQTFGKRKQSEKGKVKHGKK